MSENCILCHQPAGEARYGFHSFGYDSKTEWVAGKIVTTKTARDVRFAGHPVCDRCALSRTRADSIAALWFWPLVTALVTGAFLGLWFFLGGPLTLYLIIPALVAALAALSLALSIAALLKPPAIEPNVIDQIVLKLKQAEVLEQRRSEGLANPRCATRLQFKVEGFDTT